jgi:hypothetical protein
MFWIIKVFLMKKDYVNKGEKCAQILFCLGEVLLSTPEEKTESFFYLVIKIYYLDCKLDKKERQGFCLFIS